MLGQGGWSIRSALLSFIHGRHDLRSYRRTPFTRYVSSKRNRLFSVTKGHFLGNQGSTIPLPYLAFSGNYFHRLSSASASYHYALTKAEPAFGCPTCDSAHRITADLAALLALPAYKPSITTILVGAFRARAGQFQYFLLQDDVLLP